MDLREMGLDSCDSGKRPVVGSCEQGNESLGSTKWWEFLEWPSNAISQERLGFMELVF
jgi:hypothetical protein